MGPDMGEGGGFLPTGNRGVHTVPGDGRESNGLEFEIARSRTGDDAGSAARFGCFSTSPGTAFAPHGVRLGSWEIQLPLRTRVKRRPEVNCRTGQLASWPLQANKITN
ncbi:hypothetical protein THAOC_08376 [Thalassiosira oceanica]|uniref:Uncharacterized protein n=1 Tax=Thalassiosira oceanica TaxID=159749 RepID=K0SV71_THAOC|nr:hypothetical protein THAOC_08376 [Thalassiosira oceanica]|eukprot:EJK70278.1 hypothetical protein THAOC_08376 [Thalassiosira oceanica]